MKETTIILADDHPLIRLGLRDIIHQHDGFRVVAEAGNGERALELIEGLRPAIAILDIDMPKMSGLEVVKQILKRKIPTEIIMLTMHDEASFLERALDLGVSAYVLKDSIGSEIFAAIESVQNGKPYISSSLSNILLKHNHRSLEGIEKKLGITDLTPAERKVLKLVADNKTTKEIADMLFVSERTIESHRSSICSKLDLHGQNALLRYAMMFKNRI
ncbi:MAG: response regulator transcription factor [Bacteroidota bacterium]|jgi:DNA-binding NarL/FixJ family response regulator